MKSNQCSPATSRMVSASATNFMVNLLEKEEQKILKQFK